MVASQVMSIPRASPEVIDLTIDMDEEEVTSNCLGSVPKLEDVGSQLVEITDGPSIRRQHCVHSQGHFNHPAPYWIATGLPRDVWPLSGQCHPKLRARRSKDV